MSGETAPDYGGGSIVNLSASVLNAFGVDPPAPTCHRGVLPADLLDDNTGIVLFVCDALGLLQLRRVLETGRTPALSRLSEGSHGMRQLTSVFPSTTTAALTSLSTACAPAQHGILGHRQWMDEVGALCNMLRFATDGDDPQPLSEELVSVVPTIYELLDAASVTSFAISSSAHEGTRFSNVIHKGARFLGYDSLSEIPFLLEHSFEQAGDRPTFHYVYWHMIDALAHTYGPKSGSRSQDPYSLEMELIDRVVAELLAVCERGNRTFIFTADHGQAELSPERAIVLDEDITSRLRYPPGGGRRAIYLASDNAVELREHRLLQQEDIRVVEADAAFDGGWFGADGGVFRSRVGQLLVVSSADRQVLVDYGRGTFAYRGAHGALTDDEMLVPLLVADC